MTNATKTLATIFVIFAVITAAVKWSSGPEASQAFRSTLVSVDTSQVSKIVIQNPTAPNLTLTKQHNQWTVKGGNGPQYPADSDRIKRAIRQLNGLEVTAVATRDPQNYTRYRVDSTGINVSLYQGSDLLTSVFVGAPQSGGQRSLNNYVRLAEEKAVYAVDGFLRSTFNRGLNDWRNKQVWDIPQSDVTNVDFLYTADSSFTMTKTSNDQWISSGDTLSSYPVSRILNRLASLNASGFADSLDKANFGTEKYALQLETSGGQSHRLRLKESAADSTVYLGVTPDFPYVFTVQKDSWNSTVLKPRSELLKNK